MRGRRHCSRLLQGSVGLLVFSMCHLQLLFLTLVQEGQCSWEFGIVGFPWDVEIVEHCRSSVLNWKPRDGGGDGDGGEGCLLLISNVVCSRLIA